MNIQKRSEISKSCVLIVCALHPEAKPIIEHFGLQHLLSEYGCKIYGRKAGSQTRKTNQNIVINLLVTGVGKINTATALMWAQQLCMPKAFINIGVAGHGSAELGETLLIKKIVDEATRKAFYPSVCFPWKGSTSQLKTVDIASDEYSKDYAYDMEGSAFYDTVTRFVSAENAHIIKVVSDNPGKHHLHISKNHIQKCIHSSLCSLDLLVTILSKNEEFNLSEMEQVIGEMHEKWHVTVSQEQQLREMLQTIQIMREHAIYKAPEWQSYEYPKQYLSASKRWLLALEPKLV